LGSVIPAVEADVGADLKGGGEEEGPIGHVATSHIQAGASQMVSIALQGFQDALPGEEAIDVPWSEGGLQKRIVQGWPR
jgi:hypothetical protein